MLDARAKGRAEREIPFLAGFLIIPNNQMHNPPAQRVHTLYPAPIIARTSAATTFPIAFRGSASTKTTARGCL